MASTKKQVMFKSVEEYLAFYAAEHAKPDRSTSKYYRIGVHVAQLACEKAVSRLRDEERIRPMR